MVRLVCGRESRFRLGLSRAHSLTFIDKNDKEFIKNEQNHDWILIMGSLPNNLGTFNNKISFVILFILNEFRIKPYLEMWGNERDWDRVEIVSHAHTPTSLYLTLCLRKVFFPKQQKPTQIFSQFWYSLRVNSYDSSASKSTKHVTSQIFTSQANYQPKRDIHFSLLHQKPTPCLGN